MEPPDLYTLLGVGRRATTDEIEAAYAGWMARTGADRPTGEKADRLRYAYEVLSNPQRRSLYEAAMAAGGPDNITAAVVGYA